VDDVEEEYDRLRKLGIDVVSPPKEAPWRGKIILFRDPDGNMLQFTERNWRKYFEACSVGAVKSE